MNIAEDIVQYSISLLNKIAQLEKEIQFKDQQIATLEKQIKDSKK